jgi:hypothetical protein
VLRCVFVGGFGFGFGDQFMQFVDLHWL